MKDNGASSLFKAESCAFELTYSFKSQKSKITAYSQEIELIAICFVRKHTATGKLWVFERLGFAANAFKLRVVSSGS